MNDRDEAEAPVRITLRDIYEVVVRLDKANASERLTDHEDRIRALERQVWAWAGGAALAGALIGQIVQFALKG
jgi:hypothetical protein